MRAHARQLTFSTVNLRVESSSCSRRFSSFSLPPPAADTGRSVALDTSLAGTLAGPAARGLEAGAAAEALFSLAEEGAGAPPPPRRSSGS